MANCLAQVFYYEFESKPLLAKQIRTVWERLSILNQNVNAYVHQDLELKSIPTRPIRIRCGDLEEFDKLLTDRDGCFFGGFECQSSSHSGITSAEFSFGSKTQSRWKGIDTLPNSTLFLSENITSQIGWQNLESVFWEHLQIADDSKSIQGCFDVGLTEHLLSGMVFESIVLQKMPFHRWVEQALWVSQGMNPTRVRNLYWGNYFGSELRKKLDMACDGNFLAAYIKQARYVDGQQNGIAHALRNGVFVSVSLTPMECFPGLPLDISAQNNIVWLSNTLRKAGVL